MFNVFLISYVLRDNDDDGGGDDDSDDDDDDDDDDAMLWMISMFMVMILF